MSTSLPGQKVQVRVLQIMQTDESLHLCASQPETRFLHFRVLIPNIDSAPSVLGESENNHWVRFCQLQLTRGHLKFSLTNLKPSGTSQWSFKVLLPDTVIQAPME